MSESAKKLRESIRSIGAFSLRPPPNPKQRRHHTMFGSAPKTIVSPERKRQLIATINALRRHYSLTKQGPKILDSDAAVLTALLNVFHTQANQQVYPSFELIARAAGKSRSTVARSLKRLEATGILTHTRRITLVRNRGVDQHGRRFNPRTPVRVSNSYAFGISVSVPKCHGDTGIRSSHLQPTTANPAEPKKTAPSEPRTPPPSHQDAPTAQNGVRASPTAPNDERPPTGLRDSLASPTVAPGATLRTKADIQTHHQTLAALDMESRLQRWQAKVEASEALKATPIYKRDQLNENGPRPTGSPPHNRSPSGVDDVDGDAP